MATRRFLAADSFSPRLAHAGVAAPRQALDEVVDVGAASRRGDHLFAGGLGAAVGDVVVDRR